MHVKQILFLIFFFTLPFNSHAQTKKEKEIDSLFNKVKQLGYPYTVETTEKALRICTDVYYRSKEAGYTGGQIDALLRMTQIYYNAGDATTALLKANEGIALVSGNKEYVMSWSSFLMSKAACLSRLGYFDQSIETYQQALKILDRLPEKNSDHKHYTKALIYSMIRNSYIRDRDKPLGRKEEAFYVQNCYKEALQVSNNDPGKAYIMTKSLQGLASAHINWKEYEQARKYIEETDAINKNTESTWPCMRNILLGEIEFEKKNYTKSTEYFKTALKLSKHFKLLYDEKEIYSQLAENYRKLKDYKNESYYLQISKRLNDSLNLAEKQANAYVIKNEIKAVSSAKRPLWHILLFYFSIASTTITLIIVIYSYLKKRRPITPEPYSKSGSAYKHQLQLPDTNPEQLQYLLELAQSNDHSFYLQFKKTFPDFTRNLLHINSKLTQSDLEFCALIQLNFDTKQMASIKKISVAAVESKKYRIRKKLNISSEENMYIWLMNK